MACGHVRASVVSYRTDTLATLWIGLLFLVLCCPLTPARGASDVIRRTQPGQLHHLKCRRLPLPSYFSAGSRGIFNPAAVFHDKYGWIVVIRYDQVFWKQGYWKMRTKPVVASLGNNKTLSGQLSAQDAEIWSFDNSTFSKVMRLERAHIFQAEDFRPFLWKGDVYVSHGLSFQLMSDRQAISKMDFESRQLKLVYQFDTQTVHRNWISESVWREKNWGFFSKPEQLLVFYSFFPCTIVFAYAPADATGMAIKQQTCYDGEPISSAKSAANIIWKLTGMDIRKTHHNSGHPVVWDGGGEETRPSYLAVVHVKDVAKSTAGSQTRYYHWGLRVSMESYRVTHISRGPIVNTSDYSAEGFINVMTIGSFHLLPSPQGRILHLFMGEGDKFSCTHQIRSSDIQWIKVPKAFYRSVKFMV